MGSGEEDAVARNHVEHFLAARDRHRRLQPLERLRRTTIPSRCHVPRTRTARRVGSKTRLRFGKLSMAHGISSLGGRNPAFAQAFGIPRPPITSFAIVSRYFEGLQILLERNQGVFACGISAADFGGERNRALEFKNLEHGWLASRAYPIRCSVRAAVLLKFGCGGQN
jgi:hypothetical protein